MAESIRVLLDFPFMRLLSMHIREPFNITMKPNAKIRIFILLVEQNTKLALNVAPFFQQDHP